MLICNVVTFVNSCHIEVYRNDIPHQSLGLEKKASIIQFYYHNFSLWLQDYEIKLYYEIAGHFVLTLSL